MCKSGLSKKGGSGDGGNGGGGCSSVLSYDYQYGRWLSNVSGKHLQNARRSETIVYVVALDAWRGPGSMGVTFRWLASWELPTFPPIRARFGNMASFHRIGRSRLLHTTRITSVLSPKLSVDLGPSKVLGNHICTIGLGLPRYLLSRWVSFQGLPLFLL